MFKIGEFSCFSRVSVKMLRHYDDINLFKPAHVDPESGYRYYTADQLPRLNRIILLKDLAFSLEQIALLLDEALSSDEVRGILKLKRAELRMRLSDDTRRLALIERAVADEAPLPHPFIVREVPTQLVASIRQYIEPGEITALFEHLESAVAAANARDFSPPLTIFHDAEYTESRQDVQVAVPITRTVDMPAPIIVEQLLGGRMVCLVYTGGYASTDTLVGQFPAWLNANGYLADGPLREVYLRFGAANEGYQLPEAYLAEHAAAYVTELQLPIRNAHPSQSVEYL